MKKLLYSALALFAITSCKKEITEQQKISSLNQSQATVTNDTVYFNGDAFTGGSAIGAQNTWGDAYTDYFHLPYKDGCKIAYVSFKINIQKGAVITNMQVNVDGTIKKFARNLQNKAAGSTIVLKYDTPQLIATIYDQSDITKHQLNCYSKVQGPYNSWTRIMPDSISILGADNKPIPVKGFLHSDWPKGTPLTIKTVLTD